MFCRFHLPSAPSEGLANRTLVEGTKELAASVDTLGTLQCHTARRRMMTWLGRPSQALVDPGGTLAWGLGKATERYKSYLRIRKMYNNAF